MSAAASNPYGPATSAIRQFLQRFALLSTADQERVVAAYRVTSATRPFERAESALGDAIARSDRTAIRDSLSGPLLQLVRNTAATSDDDLVLPVGEPALAAALALMMRDVLSERETSLLYSSFDDVIALESLF